MLILHCGDRKATQEMHHLLQDLEDSKGSILMHFHTRNFSVIKGQHFSCCSKQEYIPK